MKKAEKFLSGISVDRDAATLLASATQVVARVLARRQEMDRAGQADKKLAVILGESHDRPAHALHHMMVLDGLRKSAVPTVVNFELPHNFLDQMLSGMGIFSERKRQRLRAADSNGEISLKSKIGLSATLTAPYSGKILADFVLRSKLSSRFTDAAFAPDFYMDTADNSTAESLRSCFRAVSRQVFVVSPEGILVRNHHMAVQALAHAREKKAGIIVQQCGDGHVLGMRLPEARKPDIGNINSKMQHSLAACFKLLDAEVLAVPIFFDRFGAGNIPQDNNLTAAEQIPVSGMPEIQAFYNPQMKTDFRSGLERLPDLWKGRRLKSLAEEAAYTNGVLAGAGMTVAFPTLEHYWAKEEACMTDVLCRVLRP